MPETGHSVFELAAGARRHVGIPESAEENEKSVDLSIYVVQWRQMKKGDTGSMIQAAIFLQMACSCGSSHKRGLYDVQAENHQYSGMVWRHGSL